MHGHLRWRCDGPLLYKISLVKLYPAGHADNAVKMYVILDEQSNRSLVRSQFFKFSMTKVQVLLIH